METLHPKDIPFDVLEVVFKYLTRHHPTLAACARVNRIWNAASYKALHTELQVGFKYQKARHSICPDLTSFSRFLENSPRISRFVQTLDLSWPCDTGIELCAIIRQLPKLRAITFWYSRKSGTVETQVMGADGLVWAGDDNTALFNADRVWVHAYPETFHMDVQPCHWDKRQPVLSFLSLFKEVDTLFVDGGNNAPYKPSPSSLVYPTSMKIRLLRLGKYFSGESVRDLILRTVSSHSIRAVCMLRIGDSFASMLTEESAALDLEAVHLTCGGYLDSELLGRGVSVYQKLRLVRLASFWTSGSTSIQHLRAISQAPSLKYLVLTLQTESSAAEWLKETDIDWCKVDRTIVSTLAGRAVLVALGTNMLWGPFEELIKSKLPSLHASGMLKFCDACASNWNTYNEATETLIQIAKLY